MSRPGPPKLCPATGAVNSTWGSHVSPFQEPRRPGRPNPLPPWGGWGGRFGRVLEGTGGVGGQGSPLEDCGIPRREAEGRAPRGVAAMPAPLWLHRPPNSVLRTAELPEDSVPERPRPTGRSRSDTPVPVVPLFCAPHTFLCKSVDFSHIFLCKLSFSHFSSCTAAAASRGPSFPQCPVSPPPPHLRRPFCPSDGFPESHPGL